MPIQYAKRIHSANLQTGEVWFGFFNPPIWCFHELQHLLEVWNEERKSYFISKFAFANYILFLNSHYLFLNRKKGRQFVKIKADTLLLRIVFFQKLRKISQNTANPTSFWSRGSQKSSESWKTHWNRQIRKNRHVILILGWFPHSRFLVDDPYYFLKHSKCAFRRASEAIN